MTETEITTALMPVFEAFGVDPLKIRWDQYTLALAGCNPGDLDDALNAIRKSHAFRNAPLPAEILWHVNAAKRKRIASQPSRAEPKINPLDGELKTHTIPGIGTLKIRVLPDDHPSLTRFSCLTCKDSGWEEVANPGQQMTVRRCGCWRVNPELQRERERNARHIKERGER